MIKKMPKDILVGLILLITWEISLVVTGSHWTNYIYVFVGAIIGFLIMEIKAFFLNKEILKALPLLLLPITLFILTSTPGLFGKSIIIFFNLRLILDKPSSKPDNPSNENLDR